MKKLHFLTNCKNINWWLWGIFAGTLLLRLILAFALQNFTYESYFHLRQVEHITRTGFPLFQDDLSYGGRTLVFLPLFHYLVAFFDLFLPLEFIAKILPNLFIASLTLIVYQLAKKMTKNESASLFSSFIAGLTPILYSTNAFVPESLFLPASFLTIYAFLNIENKSSLYLYIALFSILSLTSSATFLLLCGFAIYLLLLFIENKKINRAEIELILFSVFFFLWIQFLFFKNILIENGPSFIWQNIPSAIITEYFPYFSITKALISISILPFLAGILTVYQSLFHIKNNKSFLIISLVISTTLLSWLRLISFKLSLSFFAIILAILFAVLYNQFIRYFQKTRWHSPEKKIVTTIIILLLLTMAYPAVKLSLDQHIPEQSQIDAFQWISENTPKNARILSLLEEGHLVTYFAQRKNVIDDQFLLIKDIERKFSDVKVLYTTSFQTQALDLIDQYSITHLVFSPEAQKKYDLHGFKYRSGNCFHRVFGEETKVYEVKCTLATTEISP